MIDFDYVIGIISILEVFFGYLLVCFFYFIKGSYYFDSSFYGYKYMFVVYLILVR